MCRAGVWVFLCLSTLSLSLCLSVVFSKRVGVFCCGPKGISRTLHRLCNSARSSGTTFEFNKESFSWSNIRADFTLRAQPQQQKRKNRATLGPIDFHSFRRKWSSFQVNSWISDSGWSFLLEMFNTLGTGQKNLHILTLCYYFICIPAHGQSQKAPAG